MWRRVPREQYLDVGESALSQRVIPASRVNRTIQSRATWVDGERECGQYSATGRGHNAHLWWARRGDANRLGLADHDPR